MKNINIVVNTCGPFFKFGEPILSAAIDSGCHYLDICDDWEPTLEMMKLDANAKSAGVSATDWTRCKPWTDKFDGAHCHT